ncbi:hypothetical protein GF339_20355, partial [candidate division KSB3 bacterium]|nr:hypothetical protein [candidate division KSB3 bacterium]MBD3326949.1 hypothetical protein [candidate division KSB3 bacterium]
MKQIFTGMLISLVILFASHSMVNAQDERWSLEIRGGAGFATEEFGEVDLETGFGFEG